VWIAEEECKGRRENLAWPHHLFCATTNVPPLSEDKETLSTVFSYVQFMLFLLLQLYTGINYHINQGVPEIK
jgi:hypothetical protein